MKVIFKWQAWGHHWWKENTERRWGSSGCIRCLCLCPHSFLVLKGSGLCLFLPRQFIYLSFIICFDFTEFPVTKFSVCLRMRTWFNELWTICLPFRKSLPVGFPRCPGPLFLAGSGDVWRRPCWGCSCPTLTQIFLIWLRLAQSLKIHCDEITQPK